MKILEEVTAKVKTAVEQKVPSSDILMTLVEFLKRPDLGGLPGLVQKFEKAGLGQQIQSWIGKETPLPITPDEVTRALGSTEIADMAAKVGVPTEELTRHVAELLPTAVKQFAPGVEAPAGGIMGEIGSFIKDKLAK